MPTHTTLLLEPAEIEAFGRLPARVKTSWTAEAETLSYRDDARLRRMRLQLLKLRDPRLHALQDGLREAPDEAAAHALIRAVPLWDIDKADLAALFFAAGPHALSPLILEELAKGADADLEAVAALAWIRHLLLESLQRSPSAR